MNLFRNAYTKLTQEAVPFKDCLAKTYIDKDGVRHDSFAVHEHSCIVGMIAEKLFDMQLDHVKSKLPEYAIWPAIIHDIGKVCPTFQKKIENKHRILCDNPIPAEHEKLWGGHAWVSAATVLHKCDRKETADLAHVIGQHHGHYSPSTIYCSTHDSLGGENWHKERVSLMRYLANRFFKEDTLPKLELSEFSIRFLAGLTTVADWLGSGEYFDKEPHSDWEEKISLALEKAGFVSHELRKGLSFKDIFGFEPRSIQEELYSAVTGPGLYILEAPMGLGKTEASLYAAYKMLESKQANGIYFALPTQLTSEKIHERLAQFLGTICTDTNSAIAYLLHGKAWLKSDDFTIQGKDGKLTTSWFSSKKRGILAPFAAGTIDQALMSVINVRHASLRAFGLTGKVVILDELHSYDIYTGTLIDELINFLLSANCTVIILSATLTAERRMSIIPQVIGKNKLSAKYPLISAYNMSHQSFSEIAPSMPTQLTKRVCIDWSCNINECIQLAIGSALEGEQVLWIENTVNDAQERYLQIAALLGKMDRVELGLLHSRFTSHDRKTIEDHWISIYGKDSKYRSQRGRILIGTQVLEQSLDIDADRLITQLCPSDMLFQRLGRLHRHQHVRPVNNQCQATILTPSRDQLIKEKEFAFKKSRFVYEPYVLMRTLEAWQDVRNITLPDDIRPILEKSYASRVEQGDMLRLYKSLQEKAKNLRTLAMHSTSESYKAVTDDVASTRMGDIIQKDVLLMKKYQLSDKCAILTMLDYDNVTIPLDRPLSRHEFTSTLRLLMKYVVRVPEYLVPIELTPLHDALSMLACSIHTYAILGDDACIRPDNDNYKLYYSSHLGYEAKKKDKI